MLSVLCFRLCFICIPATLLHTKAAEKKLGNLHKMHLQAGRAAEIDSLIWNKSIPYNKFNPDLIYKMTPSELSEL